MYYFIFYLQILFLFPAGLFKRSGATVRRKISAPLRRCVPVPFIYVPGSVLPCPYEVPAATGHT
jgi:hypothetical protein